MKIFLTEFHYKKKYGPLDYVIAGALFLPSLVYGTIANTRNFLYKKNILKSYKSKLYTISVGNLTTGGTGKTPITAEIANYYTKKGEKPAILSRGYGGKLQNKNVNVVSDGEKIFFNAEQAGDEPVWLAENCPNAVVLTCSSRVKAAKYAEEMGCTRLILDDGFQHQKLARDLNILVADSERQFSNGKVLPMGALREPASEISRADKIVVVNKGADPKKAKVFSYLLQKNCKKPAFVCSLKPAEVYNLKTFEPLGKKETIAAFSAIGQPEQFYNFLKEDYNLVSVKDFSDHHIYTKKDIEELFKLKEQYGAKALVTTEKDAVKVVEVCENFESIYALKLAPELDLEGLLNEQR